MFAPCNTCAYEHVVENRLENDREILSAAGQCLRDGDTAAVFYVTGRNYVPEGTVQALSGTVFYRSEKFLWGFAGILSFVGKDRMVSGRMASNHAVCGEMEGF